MQGHDNHRIQPNIENFSLRFSQFPTATARTAFLFLGLIFLPSSNKSPLK